MSTDIPLLIQEFEQELSNIGLWWSNKAWDRERASLCGEVDTLGNLNTNANKGIILYTRALWFFSEAAKYTEDPLLSEKADSLYDYINRHFVDDNHGGLFWEVDCNGRVVNTRKQTFAQAFALYAYSAYFALKRSPKVLNEANDLFALIEKHTSDTKLGGHYSAFSESWQYLDNMAIDENDINAPKTLDTELHILEAYTALYKVAPNEKLAEAIQQCLTVFDEHFIDKQAYRLKTHLSRQWEDRSKVINCGHLFECAWLIWDGVMAIKRNQKQISHWRPFVIELIETGLNSYRGQHGNIFDNKDLTSHEVGLDSIWWVQSEAMVACFMAYELSRQDKFIEAAGNIWVWIKTHHIDNKQDEYGEWHAVVSDSLTPQDVPKAFMWKGPYHNGRAMLKACEYLQHVTSANGSAT